MNNRITPPLQSIVVDTSTTILCPYCGQRFEMELDAYDGAQELTTDCEVCCRPLVVRVEFDGGEIAGLDVQPG